MENQTNGKAITSLVLGILAVVTIFTGWGTIVGLVFGIIGIIFAVNAKKEMVAGEKGQGMATAGMVCSIIGTVVAGLGLLCAACGMAALGAAACTGCGLYY